MFARLAPVFVLGSLAILPAAAASFTLNQDGCSGGCFPSLSGPFPTVTLTQTGGTGAAATVLVSVNLLSGENFAGTGAGDALEFNVAGGVSITGLPTGFETGPAPDSASVFGTFLESVTCTQSKSFTTGACHGGSGPSGPLTFTVGSSTGVTVADFTSNAGGFIFASDIFGNNNTGNVGALGGGGSPQSLPEPSTLGMAGLALAGLGFLRRRSAKLSSR
jgi:hypothetical protein